ncbi:hypothetical protein D5086_013341 [Populus alba]|uniref:G-patch domain-containing protein n=2 Tax=Populus alba TaxID=43335 RepID=A0A4U5MPA9_POPAL|nr:uncharacterized protein LOC118043773 isoform X1 [Populus alba]TKR71529.1 uncharacterized protein D5086_0000300530 [Populus alba]
MAGGGKRRPNHNNKNRNKKIDKRNIRKDSGASSRSRRRSKELRNSLFVEGGVLADWSPVHSGRSSNVKSNSESGSKPGNSNQGKACSGSKNAPRKASGNAFVYNYPCFDLQEGTSRDMDESQPIVLMDSKETHIVAYLDETPTLKPCNLNLTYEYSSDFLLGESSHRELGFCEEFEATPGAESSSKQMEEEEQKGSSFDSSSSEKEMDFDDAANCRAGEEMLTAAFSPKKNSAFLSIGGMKLFTQDISDGGSDGESLDESSESQQVELSQSDDFEDTSNSEFDVDDDVAEDYLEGIGGSSNILDVKWLVENVLDDSEEDSSSSGCFDETLEKLGGIALQEASRRYGMKKPHSKRNHASSARDVSQDLDDFMHVKDPRIVSAKKKHVAHLPWSSQRSKNSRNFPGEKKKHRKEMIAVKHHQRMLSRGVDLEKINKVQRLAAVYRLHSGSQGSGKKSFVTGTRTQRTCMPSASDKLRLEKLIGPGNEDSDFAVNEGSKTKSVSADRNRKKKSTRGSSGRNGLYTNQPVSFVSSGVMQPGVVETITVGAQEINETGENKDATSSSKYGAFEVHTKGFGSKMMEKMGFIQGGGLGKDGQGMAQPIEAIQRPKSLGLGVDFSNISGDSVKNKPQSIGTGTGTGTGKSGKHSKTQSVGAFEKHTKGFGSKMMTRMGFVEGKGLGKDSQGIVNPLVAVRRPKARGLGAKS